MIGGDIGGSLGVFALLPIRYSATSQPATQDGAPDGSCHTIRGLLHSDVFKGGNYESRNTGALDVKINGRWVPTRIEMGNDWYLVGVDVDNLVGLIVRI